MNFFKKGNRRIKKEEAVSNAKFAFETASFVGGASDLGEKRRSATRTRIYIREEGAGGGRKNPIQMKKSVGFQP